jgi:uroporphyrinogen decarboxylase
VSKNIRPQRFLRALQRDTVDCTPVWLMRQAGRYLPEYKEIRKQAGDFLTLCKTPELAREVTLQPLNRFDLDAAIVFSDILTIPDAMGLALTIEENYGPQFKRPLRSERDINNLRIPDIDSELGYVMETIKIVRAELEEQVPLIGFSGSPWTLATYMIDRNSRDDFNAIKRLLYEQPSLLQKLLNVLTESIARYLIAQAKAGAQTLMIFDTWGGVLAHNDYLEFSLLPISMIIKELKQHNESKQIPGLPRWQTQAAQL